MTRISLIIIAILLAGCGPSTPTDGDDGKAGNAAVKKQDEPEYIAVEYLRVGFEGLPGDKEITRSQHAAKTRAEDALRRAKAGEDFVSLVKEFSDDEPRAYRLANTASTPKSGYFMRAGVVPALGDVGFGLAKGDVGLAAFDEKRSPYGYYVIKRTE